MTRAIVLGTAGHIDHGKTSLVRALTGIDTDRLPVEKARGITTELGFAHMTLATPAGPQPIAVVDVPGHERFVKSMVAGATGIDLVVLVVAADEGVMPQTREHLDICDLLGVQRGVVALTKSDLVDADWLALATTDVRTALADTSLADAAIVPVSTKTGAGLDDLRAAIVAAIAAMPPRASAGVFRLPIDRVFTVKGFGTVVTGTVLGGSVSIGDELSVIPTSLTTRVRGLEVHGAAVESALAGQRAAINVHALAVDQLERGDMLVRASEVAASHILDVELRYLASAPGPLGPRTKVLVHHGTSQTLATLALVGVPSLAPGSTAVAQLRLPASSPIGAVPGDRFIVRGFVATATHGTTIGGGTIVRVLAPKARRGSNHAETVATLASARLEQRIALDIKAASAAGLSRADLVRRLGTDALGPALESLVASRELLAVGDHYLHAASVAELERAIVAAGDIGREALRTQLPAALPPRAYDAILDGLAARAAIAIDKDRIGKPSPRAALSPLEQRVLAKLDEGKLEPLRPKELAPALALTEVQVKAALERLLAAKLITRIKPDLMMHAEAVAAIKERLLAFLEAHGTIDAQQWKDLTGASRKFTIPLAEYFDAEKVTLRVGDVRRRR